VDTQITQIELSNDLELRAVGAMEKLLRQMSAVRISDIWNTHTGIGSPFGILARTEVFGHRYTLACAIEPDGHPARIQATLHELVKCDSLFPTDAIPVIIAPSLSPKAQRTCREGSAGFLDLEGNACLFLGESFIGMRTSPRHAPSRVASVPAIHKRVKAALPPCIGQQFKDTREVRAVSRAAGSERPIVSASEGGRSPEKALTQGVEHE